MIPAQRTGAHDRIIAEPSHLAYSTTVTDHGSSEAGSGFRTYRASITVSAEHQVPQPRNGATR